MSRAPDTQERERRDEWLAALGFIVGTVSAMGLAVVFARGGQPQLEGMLLFGSLCGLGVGFVTWGHRLLPAGPYEQHREQLSSEPEERAEFESDFERGGVLGRRTVLRRSLTAAGLAVAAAALFPIRSLGPSPGRSLYHTPWRRGRRLVTDDGKPVLASDVPLEGLVTVFPAGDPTSADGQAVLIRVAPGLVKPKRGRETWSPNGFVAYSKVCTHAGCPVGLYQAETHQLLCPCHQSTFDVLTAAKPVTGPAAAPLPQLPLAIDAEGYLIATGDFSDPIGPAFWRRT